MVKNIPVIDVARLDSASALGAIDRACREWGFFQVVGHDIDPALFDRLLAVSREFFAQPVDIKRRISRDADDPWGYFDRELTKRRRDWKEIFDFGPGDGERHGRRRPAARRRRSSSLGEDVASATGGHTIEPRWPTGTLRPRFERAVREYYGRCNAFALQLLSAIATNLGMPPDRIAADFDATHTSFLRLNHYPRRPDPDAADGGTFGVGEHTDSGALTVLLQDDQPGLEVCRDGRWHLVQPLAGALVINIGDVVQVWSNDRYRAALHRVITDPERDRYSVPFFLNPSYETTYEPLPTTATTDEPARYRPIRWREFRALRAAGDYADLGEEIQIAHYRR